MPRTAETVSLLRVAAKLLNQVAREVAIATMEPAAHIRRIGEILCDIYDLQREITGADPIIDFDSEVDPTDLQAFVQTFNAVQEKVREQRWSEAIRLWTDYVDASPPEVLKEAANSHLLGIRATSERQGPR